MSYLAVVSSSSNNLTDADVRNWTTMPVSMR